MDALSAAGCSRCSLHAVLGHGADQHNEHGLTRHVHLATRHSRLAQHSSRSPEPRVRHQFPFTQHRSPLAAGTRRSPPSARPTEPRARRRRHPAPPSLLARRALGRTYEQLQPGFPARKRRPSKSGSRIHANKETESESTLLSGSRAEARGSGRLRHGPPGERTRRLLTCSSTSRAVRRRCAPPNSPAAPKASSSPAAMARPPATPRSAAPAPPRPALPALLTCVLSQRAGRCSARLLTGLALVKAPRKFSLRELLSPSLELGFRISSVLHRRSAQHTASSRSHLRPGELTSVEEPCSAPGKPSRVICTLLGNVFSLWLYPGRTPHENRWLLHSPVTLSRVH